MEIIDVEEENGQFKEDYLQQENGNEKDSGSNEPEDDANKFIASSTFAAIGLSPWYIGKFLKDTFRNDNKVFVDHFNFYSFFFVL